MGGIAISIQAYPEISSLIVGAVRIAIDLAIDFVDFFSKLADMLCQFEDYLEPLADFAKASQDSMSIQKTVANVYGDLLDFCQKARRLFVDTNRNRRKWTSWRLFMRQQWEPFEIEFGPIKINMQHHLDVLRIAGQALQLHNDQEAAQARRLYDASKEREQFLSWISLVDYEKVHHGIYRQKHEGTGNWLIQKEEFQTWFGSPDSSLLWCYGKPGAGKSVLASNVLEHITAKYTLDESVAICFAYYNCRTPQDHSQIAAALMKQFCRSRDNIPPRLLKFKRDSLSSSTASTQESFIMLVEELNFKERERHHIIGFITEVLKDFRCVKLFVTSRRESDIIRAFENSNTPAIQIKAENVANDIDIFVRSEVQKLRNGYHGRKLYLTSDALEKTVIQMLIEKAAGMFLWVNLQLESLYQVSEAQRDALVEEALDSLLQGLDETYTRIIERIDDQPKNLKDLALNCLMWTIYARRPLRTKELQDALALTANSACQKQTDIVVDKVEVILQACGNLLIHENDAIRPIHYSVQEFFTKPSSKLSRGRIQESIADPNFVHMMLSSVCLRYIQLGTTAEPCSTSSDLYNRIKHAQFVWYAAQCFDYHLPHCKTLATNILERVEDLLHQDGAFFAAVFQLRNVHDPFDIDAIFRDFDPVSFIVSADTLVYRTHLFEIDYIRARLVGRVPPKYALHQAASAGLLNAVVRLTEQGCHIDERNGMGNSPIYEASIRGHSATVELLLSKGVKG